MTDGINRTIYPVGLLLENRPCLIIGGGKVAARKMGGLLAANAKVTVISPALDDRIVELHKKGKIEYIPRTYQAGDTKNYTLVFAATGDRHINKTVLGECQENHIPCCPVDGNWMDGDFVTPATIRKDLLTVAIATGGQNCRRSRLIKENLSRHIDMVDSADLVVIGTSHNELRLENRESFHLPPNKQKAISEMLMQIWGLHEFMILNTCNRIELLAVKAEGQAIEDLLVKIMGFDAIPSAHRYIKTGQEAFEHLSLLASGLLSQATGEFHIVAQIKQALETANQNSWSGGMLAQWVGAALHVSKNIRNTILQNAETAEIEDTVISYLQEQDLTPTSHVVVIGTGTVGQGIAKRLADLNIAFDWIFHQNQPKEVPEGASILPFNVLAERLQTATHVISAVQADDPIIGNSHKNDFLGRNVCLIDLSAPRSINISPAPENIQIVDLDGLKTWKTQSDIYNTLLSDSQQTIRQHFHLYDQIISSFAKDSD